MFVITLLRHPHEIKEKLKVKEFTREKLKILTLKSKGKIWLLIWFSKITDYEKIESFSFSKANNSFSYFKFIRDFFSFSTSI